MNHLIDHELDLSGFDARFRNDVTGGRSLSARHAAEGYPGRLFTGHHN